MPAVRSINDVTSEEREAIYQRVREQVIQDMETDDPQVIGRNCLSWATHLKQELLSRGVEGIQRQAGSVAWQFREVPAPECTHWGYQWSPDSPSSHFAQEMGGLPERHVWVAGLDRVARRHQLIDLTTGFMLEIVEATWGQGVWTFPQLPRYFWGTVEELPRGCRYTPTLEATTAAYFYAKARALTGIKGILPQSIRSKRWKNDYEE